MKTVLFDIDGTIVKCGGAGREALERACIDVFGTAGEMKHVDFQGKTDPYILNASLQNMGYTKDSIRENLPELKNRYFYYLEEYIEEKEVLLLPGAKELIMELKKNDRILLGILTGNFEKSAQIKLNRFGLFDHFSFGVYGDDSEDRNRMPEIAKNRIESKFNTRIDFTNMIIIGDTIHDIACAKHSGAVSLAVGTGWTEHDILINAGPDHFFKDLADTEIILNTISSYS